jgi:hypothetical protein
MRQTGGDVFADDRCRATAICELSPGDFVKGNFVLIAVRAVRNRVAAKLKAFDQHFILFGSLGGFLDVLFGDFKHSV